MPRLVLPPDLTDAEPGARLKWARQQKHATIIAATDTYGWPYEMYKKQEANERGISMSYAKRYGTALGVPPVWLLTGRSEFELSLSDDESRLLTICRALSDEGRQRLLAYAEFSLSQDPSPDKGGLPFRKRR